MKVLYADSELETREYVSMILESGLDCEILEVSSGNEALTILEMEASEIDFIISEVEMNGGGGDKIVEFLQDKSLSIPVVWLSDEKNLSHDIVSLSQSLNSLSSFVSKPFRDDAFFPVIDKILVAIENKKEPAQKSEDKTPTESTQEKEDLVAEKKEVKGAIPSVEADWDTSRAKKKKASEVEADWDLGVKKKNVAEVEADWGVHPDKKKASEVEADWSLDQEKKNVGEMEADWSLDQEKENAGEIEADWDIDFEKKNAGEEEADWDLKNKGSSEEMEADWGVDPEKKNAGEEDADWDLKNKGSSEEIEADWEINSPVTGANDFSEKWSQLSESDDNYDQEAYYAFSSKRLLSINDTPCDIFLNLSTTKTVKILNAHDVIAKDIVQKYQKKGIRKFLVEKDNYEGLLEKFASRVFDSLEVAAKHGGEIKVVAELAAYQSIIERTKLVGINDATARNVAQAIESNLKTFENNKSLAALFKKMMRGGDFISEHSLMLSYIAGQICLGTSWGNTPSLQKLSMAALLHDSDFSNEPLCRMHDLEPEKIKSCPKELQDIVSQHMIKAAQLISEGKQVFPDVEQIVMQQHEKPDKSGYPNKLGALSLSPMSCTFIMAHEFVNEIYREGEENIKIEALKERFNEEFSRGNFKKPLEAFLKVF